MMYNVKITNSVIAHAQKQASVLFAMGGKIIDPTKNEYTYLITGEPGASGKTFLTNELKLMGYNAVELTKDFIIHAFGFKIDMHEGIYEDHQNKILIVVLNPNNKERK